MKFPSVLHSRRETIQYTALALATVVAAAAGWLVLRTLEHSLASGTAPAAGRRTVSPPHAGVRIFLANSPYYSPTDPPAPNPGDENPTVYAYRLDPRPAGANIRPRQSAHTVIELLAEALKGRAEVRPAVFPEFSHPSPSGAIHSEGRPAAAGSATRGLVPGTPAEPSPGPWVIVEFPADTPLGEAIDVTTRTLQSLQQKQIARVLQAGKKLADSLQESIGKCRRDGETFRAYMEQVREARQAFRTLISTFALQQSRNTPSFEPDPSNEVLELECQYRALAEKRTALLATRTPEHPEVKQVEAALRELEAQLRLRVRDARSGSQESSAIQQWPPAWITLPDNQRVASHPRAVPDSAYRSGASSLSLSAGTPSIALFESLVEMEARYEGLERIGQDIATQLSSMGEGSEELSRELESAIEECWAVLSWRIVGSDFPPSEAGAPVRKNSPAWWHWLLALLVCILSGEATYALVEGAVRPRVICSPEDIQELMPVPVFTIHIPTNAALVRPKTRRLRAETGHTGPTPTPHARQRDGRSQHRSKAKT